MKFMKDEILMGNSIKDAILKSLEELKNPSTHREVYRKIVEQNHCDFADGKTLEAMVASQLSKFIRSGDTRVKRIKIDKQNRYFLSKLESDINFEIEALSKATEIEDKTSQDGLFVTILFMSIIIFTGIFALSISGKAFKLSIASKTWPSTQGIITSTEVVREDFGSGTKRRTSYHPVVRYSYAVDMKSFNSDVISFANSGTRFRNDANTIIAKYPVNSNVEVYYDSSLPEIAVLEPGLTFTIIFKTLVAGCLGLLFVISGAWAIIRRVVEHMKKDNEPA